METNNAVSRTPTNPGLIALLKKKEDETGFWFKVPDVGRLCHCHVSSVWRYTTGVTRSPKLEVRMAEIFNLTVLQLREVLKLKQPKRRRSVCTQSGRTK